MKQIIQEFLIENFFPNHIIDNFGIAYKISIMLAIIPGIIFPSINMWLLDNIDYISLALGAVALDHLLGSYVHYFIKDDWNFKKNIGGFSIKLSMVVAMGFLIEAMAHITIEDDLIYRYIKMSGRLMVIIYPILSAAANIKIITKGDFPPDVFFKKGNDFYRDMNLNHFRDKPLEEEQNNKENNKENNN